MKLKTKRKLIREGIPIGVGFVAGGVTQSIPLGAGAGILTIPIGKGIDKMLYGKKKKHGGK